MGQQFNGYAAEPINSNMDFMEHYLDAELDEFEVDEYIAVSLICWCMEIRALDFIRVMKELSIPLFHVNGVLVIERERLKQFIKHMVDTNWTARDFGTA